MVYKRKYKIIDNLVTACDYDYILSKITKAINNKKGLLISPVASHTLVRAHFDKNLKKILDKFDYLVPDSQWVRWSIPFLYGKNKSLKDRVYGPELMLKTCHLATNKHYKIFLYGNTSIVLGKLKKRLKDIYPSIDIAGGETSVFRELNINEWKKLTNKIDKSKINIIFISLGSPKQEFFSYDLSRRFEKSLIIIPVGAAFNFISKAKPQAPEVIQNFGLEWLFRLSKEFRLFKRYLIYGTLFILIVIYTKAKTLLFK